MRRIISQRSIQRFFSTSQTKDFVWRKNNACQPEIIFVTYPKYEKIIVEQQHKNNYLVKISLEGRHNFKELIEDENYEFDFYTYEIHLIKFCYKTCNVKLFKSLLRYVNKDNFQSFICYVIKCGCSKSYLVLLKTTLDNLNYKIKLDQNPLKYSVLLSILKSEFSYRNEVFKLLLDYKNIEIDERFIFYVISTEDPYLLKVFLESPKIDPSYLYGNESVFAYCEMIKDKDTKEVVYQMLKNHPILLEKYWIE